MFIFIKNILYDVIIFIALNKHTSLVLKCCRKTPQARNAPKRKNKKKNCNSFTCLDVLSLLAILFVCRRYAECCVHSLSSNRSF